MRKIIVVAVREYQAAVRTKAFIVMLVAMPVLMSGGLIAIKVLEGQVRMKAMESQRFRTIRQSLPDCFMTQPHSARASQTRQS